jgi:hypothetical protein
MLYRRRVLPLSQGRGFDYGTPVNRYYSGTFIRSHAHEVRGRILEFVARLMRTSIRRARALISADLTSVSVTMVADVQKMPQVTDAADASSVPGAVPRSLLRPDPRAHAGRCCCDHRVSLPTQRVPGDYWRFTEDSLRLLLAPFSEVSVSIHGNPIAAFCAANRIAIEDASRADLDWADPRFPLHVNVYARK